MPAAPLPSSLLIAILCVVLWCAGSLLIRARRMHQRERAGLTRLNRLKWREFTRLLIGALGQRGLVADTAQREVADAGYDLALARGDERLLLQCKHGEAYTVTPGTVQEFANALHARGADSGILVTTGRVQPPARLRAQRLGIELIDGGALWRLIEPVLPDDVLADVEQLQDRGQLRAQVRFAAGMVVLGAAVALWLPALSGPQAGGTAVAPARAVAASMPGPVVATQSLGAEPPATSDDGANDGADGTAPRERAALAVRSLDGVLAAHWNSRSTLVIDVAAARADDLDRLVADACTLLVAHEDLRYTRLQLQLAAPEAGPAVRWRQCR